MPSTRPQTSREEKEAEILDAASRQLRAGGLEALSVAAIARELGIAQNSIYWYFPSKDRLLVATVERMLAAIVARKPRKREAGEVERILWFTDQYQELTELRGAMRERARSSEVVAEFLDRLDATLSRMLANTLRDRLPPDELTIAVEAFRATVEGTVVRNMSDAQRRRVLAFALERLLAPGA